MQFLLMPLMHSESLDDQVRVLPLNQKADPLALRYAGCLVASSPARLLRPFVLQDALVAKLKEAVAARTGYAPELLEKNLIPFAVAHRDVIVKFGRFPHRNDKYGRETTVHLPFPSPLTARPTHGHVLGALAPAVQRDVEKRREARWLCAAPAA